jgi:hypothetical protein
VRRSRGGRHALSVNRRDVGRTVEDDHEQTRTTVGGGMVVDRASLEVAIRAGTQELSVGLHDSFKQNDRMRRRMSVPLCAKVRRKRMR